MPPHDQSLPLKAHWERVYETKATNAVSWFQEHAGRSLQLIQATGAALSSPLLDVGSGASTLVDDLLASGYSALSVLDLSAAALAASQARLGAERAAQVRWLVADVTEVELPAGAYELWHDRAVFHFLTTAEQRRKYVKVLRGALRPGGHVILATFAEDGPTQCSGLPVVRYRPQELAAELGGAFTLVSHEREAHGTPFGTVQQFLYCHFVRNAS